MAPPPAPKKKGDKERPQRAKRRPLDGRRNHKLAAGIKPDTVFDYKDVALLRRFISERGKIAPRRLTGMSARQHRQLVVAIKRARAIALLPFACRTT